jgi:hypothetical protein
MLVRNFLHARPLAYEIDDWIVYWIKKRAYLNKRPNKGRGLWGDSSDEESEKIEVPKPPKCKSGSKPARRCADLFDWE